MENKDLKTGMILVTEKDEYVMVLKDTENGDIVSGDTWMPIYEDIKIIDDLKVKKIYQPLNNRAYLSKNTGFMKRNIETTEKDIGRFPFLNLDDYKLIWERKEKRKMTVSEICKKLGYDIEIVKEN